MTGRWDEGEDCESELSAHELLQKLKEERARVSGYKTLVKNLERHIDFYQKQNDKITRLLLQHRSDNLESERKANEILTNEVERLENVVRELQARLLEGRH